MIIRANVILLACLLLALPPAAAASLPEYQVKAAFLHNFGKYVSWPAIAFAEPAAPFVIGILGDDPFGEAFAPLLAKTVQKRPLAVRRLARVEDARHCHVLFISRSEQRRLAALLKALKASSTLTVSDMDDFTRNGGMIRLFVQDSRIRFDINLKAAREAGLTVSANMLHLATEVME